jgi:hypothetical protein
VAVGAMLRRLLENITRAVIRDRNVGLEHSRVILYDSEMDAQLSIDGLTSA